MWRTESRHILIVLYKLRCLMQSVIETTSSLTMQLGLGRRFFLSSSLLLREASSVILSSEIYIQLSNQSLIFNSWLTIHVSQVILGHCQRDYFLIIKYVVLELEAWLGSLPHMECARLVIREIDPWVPISFQQLIILIE